MTNVLQQYFGISTFLKVRLPLPNKYPLFYQNNIVYQGTIQWSSEELEFTDILHSFLQELISRNPSRIASGSCRNLPIFLRDTPSNRLLWALRPSAITKSPSISSAVTHEVVSTKGLARKEILLKITGRCLKDCAGVFEPHVYIFAPHGNVSCLGTKRPVVTDLEKRYDGSQGLMFCLVDEKGQSSDIPVLRVSETATHVAIYIYCRKKTKTIVPIYQVISRGYVSVSDIHLPLTTFAGPMSSSYAVDRSMATVRTFDYVPHYVFSLTGEDKESLKFESAPKRLFSDKVERALNTYTECMYSKVSVLRLRENQSFIYRGLNHLLPITILAYFDPDTVSDASMENSLDRLQRRRGMSRADFCRFMNGLSSEKLQADFKLRLQVKQIVIEACNLINTFVYTEDEVFGVETDMHQSIRLTNTGDCEDAAEGVFRIIQYLVRWKNARREDTRALCQFLQTAHVTPLFVHMRVNYPSSNSHSVASGAVLENSSTGSWNASKSHHLYFMEGTTTEHGDFCDDNDEDSQWRVKMAKIIPSNSKLDFYKEPCAQTCGGSSDFYVGFVGAIVCAEGETPVYAYFADSKGIVDKGTDVCKTTMSSDYSLKNIFTVSEMKSEWFQVANQQMQYLAALSPPLPPDAAGDLSFLEQYRPWLDRLSALQKKVENTTLSSHIKAFTVFLNLCITEKEFEDSLNDIKNISAMCAEVKVTPFSLFKGSIVCEINFR